VVGQARRWAERIVTGPSQSAPVRLDNLYEIAFSRPPTLEEARACLAFLDRQMQAGHAGQGYDTERQTLAWTALCHVLVNMKEFIFID
jgi:hypothetical protein